MCWRSAVPSRGSLVNPRAPAPVNSRAVTIKLVANCLIGALSQIVPDKVPAFNANQHVLSFGGRRADGTNFVMGEVICGGLRKGDRLVVETAGGGDFGDPQRRQEASIHRDLVDEKVTAAGAALYGVPKDAAR